MADYSVESVKTTEWTMDYATFGHGTKPFVLLPGLSLLPVTPMAHAVAMQYRKFHDGYKIYLFDRRRDVPDGYNIDQMVDDTAAAMKQLGIEHACVMGCSQGGMMAMVMAHRYPELVSSLVLCNTASHATPEAQQVVGNWVQLALAGDVVTLNRDVYAHVYSPAYYEKYADAFRIAEKMGTDDDLKRFVKLAGAVEGYDAREILPHIHCPALVVGSSIDQVLGGDSSPQLAQALGARLIMYDQYGHAAYDEARDLHTHILSFLDNQQ